MSTHARSTPTLVPWWWWVKCRGCGDPPCSQVSPPQPPNEPENKKREAPAAASAAVEKPAAPPLSQRPRGAAATGRRLRPRVYQKQHRKKPQSRPEFPEPPCIGERTCAHAAADHRRGLEKHVRLTCASRRVRWSGPTRCTLRARRSLAPPVIKPSDQAAYDARPMVDGRKILVDGKVLPWSGAVQEVFAPIYKVRLWSDTPLAALVSLSRALY
jgi:hypothetical protein